MPVGVRRVALCAFVGLWVVALVPNKLVDAAVGGGMSPTGERANAADLKYVACSVCQEVSKHLARRTVQLRKERGSYHFSEDDIFKLTENVCNTQHKDGKWMNTFDVQEHSSGNHQLVLVPQKKEGHCGSECMTISKSCKDTIDAHESELVELLWDKNSNRASVASKLCNSWTKSCNPKQIDALYDSFVANEEASGGAEPFLTELEYQQQKKAAEEAAKAEASGAATDAVVAAAGGIWNWLMGLMKQLPHMSVHGIKRWARKQWKTAKNTDWKRWWKEWADIKQKESKELYKFVKKHVTADARKFYRYTNKLVSGFTNSGSKSSSRSKKNRGGKKDL